MALTNQVCRTCLCTKESFSYILFDNVSPKVFSFCTSIEVQEDEELPKTLCNSCYDLLEKYSNFKRICLESQNTLTAYQCNTLLKGECKLNDVDNKCLKQDMSDVKTVKTDYSEEVNSDAVEGYTHSEFIYDEEKRYKKCTNKIIKRRLKIKVKKRIKARVVFEFNCDTCRKKFKYKDRYEAHKLEHLGLTVSKSCTMCNKTFMTWSGLQRHSNSEHKVVKLDTLRCKQCGKVFKNQQTLRLHAKLHTLPNNYACVCDICGKSYSSPVTLKLHLEGHNENRKRNFSCEHCGKKFFTKNILKTHIKRLHTGLRFICQICSFPFTDKYNLSKHLLKHQGIKDHQCDICQKYFSSGSTLIIHKRIHSGERPYNCSYCPKAFSSRNRLVIHHRVHTGERPHRCSVCNQAFTQLGTMKRHMKTHSKTPLEGL